MHADAPVLVLDADARRRIGRLLALVAEAVARELGKAFKPGRVVWVAALPKTRSAKIVRRAVRAKALGEDPGDLSSLENPESLEEIANAV